MRIKTYRVIYAVDVEATSPHAAALEAADILSQDGAPERGFYNVKDLAPGGEETNIDLGMD